MKIAIYQGFPFHYEMFGYILEYLTLSKISVDLYCVNTEEVSYWVDFYQMIFKTNLYVIHPKMFDPINYDLIFLLTDDDITFNQEWLDNFSEKIISIDHTAQIRNKPNNITRLGTRFFYFRPNCLWALPVYNYVNRLEKIKCLNKQNQINVISIGQFIPKSVEELKKIFVNFDSIEFNIISRKIDSDYENLPNIKIWKNCPTNKMMELIKNAHYALCCEKLDRDLFKVNSISGIIPLAFNSGCQLIIPKSWQEYYNFNSVITYDHESPLFLSSLTNLDKIYDERYELINHKNRMLEYIISSKLELPTKNYKNNLLNNINKSIMSIIPNVFIDLTDNINKIINQTNNFREINCFIDKDLNLSNIYYHSDKEKFLDQTIYKIKEPCLIDINNNINTKLYLSKLAKRAFRDVIILNNISYESNIYEFLSVYKKLISVYPIQNLNSVLIISQN